MPEEHHVPVSLSEPPSLLRLVVEAFAPNDPALAVLERVASTALQQDAARVSEALVRGDTLAISAALERSRASHDLLLTVHSRRTGTSAPVLPRARRKPGPKPGTPKPARKNKASKSRRTRTAAAAAVVQAVPPTEVSASAV